MSKNPYMPLYGNEWRGGTEDIPSEFRGPYLDLLWIIFDQGGRVPNIESALARHARLTVRPFRRFWVACGHKFIVDDDQIGHRKTDAILAGIAKVSAVNRKSASKGGRKTQQNQRRLQANAKVNQTKGLVSAPTGQRYQPRLDKTHEDKKNDELGAADSAPQLAERSGRLSASSGNKRGPTLRERLGEENYIVWRDLREDLQCGGRVANCDLDHISRSLVGFAEGAFIIDSQPLSGERWIAVQEIASVEGLSFDLRQQPTLKAIAGGKSNDHQ